MEGQKNIYIVGGNGFAREVFGYIKRMAQNDKTIAFKGFLGEGGYVPDLKDFNNMFLGDVSNFEFQENDYVVLGSGDSYIRKRTYDYLKKIGAKFFTVIDPSCIILDYVNFGEANIFAYMCFMYFCIFS